MFELQKKDFKIKCVYEIAPWRTSDEDNLKACVFLDYAPQVFDSIRKKFNVEREEYSKSLGPDQILTNLLTGEFNSLSELCSSGKSGSFFYYTADGKYMLKTISKNEFKFFKRILRNYYYHIENNDATLITRIYGLHKMLFFSKNRKTEKKLFFCIMNNVFHTSKEIHKRYDLKGSTQGRTTKYANNQFDPTIALKDNDIVDQEEFFVVTKQVADKLKAQIRSDVNFFRENNIIDYSLLIGIHDTSADVNTGKRYMSKSSNLSESEGATPTVRDFTHATSVPFYEQNEGGVSNYNNQKIYFLGVIDILTEYNTKKKMEHFLKSFKYGNTISCVPPDMYATRFEQFICSRILDPMEYREIGKTLHKKITVNAFHDDFSEAAHVAPVNDRM
jgi:1-phosphatidylinositol-4-phosphate 5-kinase